MVLHMPIGIFIGLFVLEFGGAIIRRQPSRATVCCLAWVGAIGAAMAADHPG